MQKRAQQTFSMSFGMIFSIFLIIIIVSFAIYAIIKFVDIGDCAQTGLFYDELQDEINRAWNSGSGAYLDEKFEITINKKVKHVCFGDPAQASGTSYASLGKIFEDYPSEHNVFLVPPEKICDGLVSKRLEHATFPGFFCEEVDSTKIEFSITKESGESSVRIRPD